jgi:protein gp37
VPESFILEVWLTMAMAKEHQFQVLTKRPERMRQVLTGWQSLPGGNRLFADDLWPLPNVWLGVSVENQAAADSRIPLLLDTPAAVRFLSCEPLLGPVFIEDLEFANQPIYGPFPGGDPRLFSPDLDDCTPAEIAAWRAGCVEWDTGQQTDRGPGCATIGDASAWTGTGFGIGVYRRPSPLDWVIVGGESGPGARPCDLTWIRDIVAQCREAGVAVFVKQLGARPVGLGEGVCDQCFVYGPGGKGHASDCYGRQLGHPKGGELHEWPHDLRVREFPR